MARMDNVSINRVEFSFIIPVYNLSDTIGHCIASILSQQTTVPFEIIVIDDGSTDNSLQVVQELAGRNNPIKVIHQENGGVASARNRGIDESKGKWICFVDGDDIIAPNYLSYLKKSVSSDTALVMFGWKYLFRDGSFNINSPVSVPEGFEELAFFKRHLFYGYVWCYCFNKDIIDKFKIRFTRDLKYAEDWEFILHYYSVMRGRIVVLPYVLYSQIQTIGSATQKPLGRQYIEDTWKMFGITLTRINGNKVLRRMVIVKFHELNIWLVNHAVYGDSGNNYIAYRKCWYRLFKIHPKASVHPLFSFPLFVKKKTFSYLIRLTNKTHILR